MECLLCVTLPITSISKLISELREWKVCVIWTPHSAGTDHACSVSTAHSQCWGVCVCVPQHLGLKALKWEWVLTRSVLGKVFFHPTVGNSRHNFAVLWRFALVTTMAVGGFGENSIKILCYHSLLFLCLCKIAKMWFGKWMISQQQCLAQMPRITLSQASRVKM